MIQVNGSRTQNELADPFLFLDIDDPLPASSSGGGNELSEAELGPLMDMGFTIKQAKLAMKETVSLEIFCDCNNTYPCYIV